MKTENIDQVSKSNAQVIPLEHSNGTDKVPSEQDWKTIREENRRRRLVQFRDALSNLQKQFGVSIVPQITFKGTEVIPQIFLEVED